MARYLFLIRHEAGAFTGMSPDQMQKMVTSYRDWVRRLRDSGAYVASERLADDGRILRGAKDRLRVSDGPYPESKEFIAGFYLVEAADYDRAVALARDCPVLERGVLEIREIAAG